MKRNCLSPRFNTLTSGFPSGVNEAPLPQAAHIMQKPRFYGVRVRSSVVIHCESPLQPPLHVDWFWAKDSEQEAEGPMSPNASVAIRGKTRSHSAFLLLKDVRPSDSGVYYCEVNGVRGPGTGLQVMRESLWALRFYPEGLTVKLEVSRRLDSTETGHLGAGKDEGFLLKGGSRLGLLTGGIQV